MKPSFHVDKIAVEKMVCKLTTLIVILILELALGIIQILSDYDLLPYIILFAILLLLL